MGAELLKLLPELLLLLGAVGGLLLGLWTPQQRQGRVRVVVVLCAVASAIVSGIDLGGADTSIFDGTWVIDTTTGVVRITVALGTAVAVLICSSSLAGHPRESEAYVLMLLGALGAIALAASGDLLMLIAGYLLASIPLYALAGFVKDARGVEATLKYYLMGALLGVFLLIGTAALILAAGASGYAPLAAGLAHAPAPLVAFGVIGVLAGVMFKAGAVPVHFWVPDVTAGTTPAIAAYLTTIPKIGAVAAAFRLLADPFAHTPLDVPLIIAVIAAVSMTVGNLAAFAQTEVLRLLAYSTISQVGYLFMVVAVAARTDLDVPALAVYLAAYALTNLGAFAAAAAFPGAATISEWSAAVRQRPWLALSLAILLLSLVGTPPTAVFVGKLAVFNAATDGGLGWLMVIAAINTVASLFYYLRWLAPAARSVLTAGAGGDSTATAVRVDRAPVITAHAAAAGSILLGIGAGIWMAFIAR